MSNSFFQLAKTYGSVFKVYFGTKKVIVLAGYKTVKQALVNYAEEFGEREINHSFKFAENHGKGFYIIFKSCTTIFFTSEHFLHLFIMQDNYDLHFKSVWRETDEKNED